MPKMFVDSNQRIKHINSSYLPTLLLKLQWHSRIYEETFQVNSSANNTNYLKFYGLKVKSTEIATLAIIRETLIWGLGDTVQNLESPRLSGRVGSTDVLVYKKSCS